MTTEELSEQIRDFVDEKIRDIPGEYQAMALATDALQDARSGYEMRLEELEPEE